MIAWRYRRCLLNDVVRNLDETRPPIRRGVTQQEIATMINPKFLADRLFGLNLRMRFRKSGRRRLGNPLSKFAAEVSLLEERCLMSRSALVVHVKAGPRAKGKHAEANSPMPGRLH